MRVAPGILLGDRYQVERALARGGMGEVWVATDTRFNAPVAVKLASPPAEGREEFRHRFKREAVIGRLLGSRSTGFVRALDWGELPDGGLFLVMDLIEGGAPLDLTQGSRAQRLGRLAQAARLVQELHALGIVHRDVKPQNFFLATDGSLRLGDFGLARLADEPEEAAEPLRGDRRGQVATPTGISVGTPHYMAPEQLSAQPVDQRADVYPLGVMLFQALTARLPYDGSLQQLFTRHQRVLGGHEPPPRPRQHDETIPPELETLCLEAMQPDPKRRLRSAVGFADRLEAWLRQGGSRAATHPASASGRLQAPRAPAPPAQGRTTAAPPPPPRGLIPMQGQEGVYRWERDGSLLVWVPPGFFYPGARDDDPGKTLTQVKVKGFYMARYPVTWRQWARFCKETGRPPHAPLIPAGEDHPVHGVAWEDAQAYCRWAGLRLPEEAEWEYAARGDEPRRYPWGDQEPGPTHMNWGNHPQHRGATTSPVGSFPGGASPFGLHDMAGNVQEWTEGGNAERRPLRGGAYNLPAAACRPCERVVLPARTREPGVGFRVALSAAPAGGAGSATEVSQSGEDPLARKRTTRRMPRADVRAQLQGGAPQRPGPAAPPPPTPARSAPPARPRPSPGPAARAPGTGRRPRPGPAPRPAPPHRAPPPAVPVQPPAPAPLFVPPPPTDRTARTGVSATGRRPRNTPAQDALLDHVEALLSSFAQGVGRKGNELKFTSTGDPPLSLSFLALDPEARWACLEQRVTFDPQALQGHPSGWANLLLATNLITHYGRGIRCLVTEDRLRYRRELLLSPGPEPLLMEELRRNLAILLDAWTAVFGPLRDVQSGVPWHEALASLLEPRAPRQPGVLQAIEASLTDLEPERQANRLRVLLPGLEEPIDLVWSDDLSLSTLLRPWAPPLEETMAVRAGEPAPQVEALLEELNLKNASRPYALCWDPKRGVVARTHLAGDPPPRARIMDALALLDMAAREERFPSLGD